MVALAEDLRRVQAQYQELEAVIKRHEANISIKQKEIASLEAERAAAAKAQSASETFNSTLKMKIDALTTEMATRDKERQVESTTRHQLEKDLDELRQVMAAKTSEDTKRRQADQSRETEMSNLRQQVTALQRALDDQRDKALAMASKLRVDVEGLRQSHTSAQKDLAAAQAALGQKEKDLAASAAAVRDVEQAKRKVETELAGVREQLRVSEQALAMITQARDVSWTSGIPLTRQVTRGRIARSE